jgi:hypothetical protein
VLPCVLWIQAGTGLGDVHGFAHVHQGIGLPSQPHMERRQVRQNKCETAPGVIIARIGFRETAAEVSTSLVIDDRFL